MTHLIDRSTVFKKFKNIATEISEMQKAFYDEDYLEQFCSNEKQRNEYLKLFDAKDLALPEVERIYKKISFDYTDINFRKGIK